MIDDIYNKFFGNFKGDPDDFNLRSKFLYQQLKKERMTTPGYQIVYDEFETITISEYRIIFDEFEKKHPSFTNKEFGHRKEFKNRTLGEFAVDIYNKSYKLGIKIAKFLGEIFGNDITLVHHGIEESGALICQSNRSKDEFKKADFRIMPYDLLLEVKDNSCCFKATYKTGNLRDYQEQEAFIFTALRNHGDGDICGGMFTLPEMIKEMLTLPTSIRREVGNREAVQFYINLDKDAIEYLRKHDELSKHSVALEEKYSKLWWFDGINDAKYGDIMKRDFEEYRKNHPRYYIKTYNF